MSTESDFGSDLPAQRRDPKQPPQRSTRQPAEGTDNADPAARQYDRAPADRGGPPQERSPRDPAEGGGGQV
jgi:hypothetical protein